VLQNDNRTQTVTIPNGVSSFSPALSATWSTAGDGTWCDGTKWAGGSAPAGAATTATFGAVGAAAVHVAIDTPQRIGTMNFNSSGTSYTIDGACLLTMLAANGAGVNVLAGKPRRRHAHRPGCIDHDEHRRKLIASDREPPAHSRPAHQERCRKSARGRAVGRDIERQRRDCRFGGGRFVASQHAGAVDDVGRIGRSERQRDGHRLRRGIQQPAAAGPRPDRRRAQRRSLGCAGLTSSSARANASTTLAAIEGSEFHAMHGAAATFAGVTVDDSAVLVQYTYYGDTDLNGRVNFDDYVRTDNGFNNHLSGWMTATSI
jgi:hypothetical protein